MLILAYGNPGRRDDGLGPALAEALESLALPGVTIDSDYQLTVEHAAAIAEHDFVIFADADANGPEPFSFGRISPAVVGDDPSVTFSSHSISPQGVLALAEELFGARVPGYLLGIRGYEFNEFGEGLSARAAANLAAALEFIKPILSERTSCVSLHPRCRERAAQSDDVPVAAAPANGEI